MSKPAITDILAGLAVAGLILPEGVAYAQIAGLPPGMALNAAIAGGLAYGLVGRSRFAVLSPTSSSAAILAATLATLPGGGERMAMADALVLAVGAIFLGLAAFRLGGLAGFISRPVLRGFAFGLAITIIVKQVPLIVGVGGGGGSIARVAIRIAAQAADWHPASVVFGIVALAAILGLRRVPGVPGTLVVLAAGVTLASLVDLPAHGVALAGPITLQRPALALPPLTPMGAAHLLELAAPIALILFAESWGTIRGLALAGGDSVRANRELAGIGIANLAAGLAQGMPVGAGFSAGSANAAAGARTRLAATVGACALLVLALGAGPAIARIPEPVLAAVVIAALTHALAPAPLMRLVTMRRDAPIAAVAAVGVLALGVLNGMLAAIALSIAQLLYSLSHPSVSELGQVAVGHDFVDLAAHADAHRLAGFTIWRPNAPLIFANAESTLTAIGLRAGASAAHTVVLSLEESNDLDATAVDVIGEFVRARDTAGQRVVLARVHDRVRDVLTRAGLGALAAGATYSVADATALDATVTPG